MLCLLDREGPGAGACALDWPSCWLVCSWVVPICTNILHSSRVVCISVE
uniref:Putative integral membrane protein 2B variant 1 n=1 Tax=Taeniopygia guttata TaxID=59729 RepID=B5FZ94_TAEGU|nr:putative integral membrane protein 2B variant 1 [Taeniopygia guttata]